MVTRVLPAIPWPLTDQDGVRTMHSASRSRQIPFPNFRIFYQGSADVFLELHEVTIAQTRSPR